MRSAAVGYLLLSVAGLSACSGGGSAPAVRAPALTAAPTPSAVPTAVAPANVSLRIVIAAATPSASSSVRRAPAYVSPSTQSLTVAVNGGSPAIVNLTSSSPNCAGSSGYSLSCTASVGAPAGSDTFAITLYAGTGGSGSVLGTKTLTQTVQLNAANTIPLVVNGVVNSIGVLLSAPALPAGTAATLPLYVNAFDAQGNIIVGGGSYVDASGNPLTIVLSAQQTTPTVQSPYSAGAATPSLSALTAPSQSVSVSYDGNALLSTQFTAFVSGNANIASAGASLAITPTVYEYPAVPSSGPYSLTVGPDKQIWVTLFGISSVEHFAPPAPGATTLNATSFVMPDTSSQWALGITAGSDGNMWIASWDSEVFVCSLLGSCTIINVPANHPDYLVDGGDGNIYLNESYYSGPYRYGISSQSEALDFGDIGGGNRLTLGPDGRVWATGGQGGCCNVPFIVALPTLTSANQSITQVSMAANTTNVAAGPDGNIWYLESDNAIVGHLASLTATTPTGITISTPSGPSLRDIEPGPDGNMYFTEPAGNKVARVLINATTPAGITEYPVLTPSAGLIDLVAGPDGNIWFVENSVSQIGKLAL